jgi:hypothetical protein
VPARSVVDQRSWLSLFKDRLGIQALGVKSQKNGGNKRVWASQGRMRTFIGDWEEEKSLVTMSHSVTSVNQLAL